MPCLTKRQHLRWTIVIFWTVWHTNLMNNILDFLIKEPSSATCWIIELNLKFCLGFRWVLLTKEAYKYKCMLFWVILDPPYSPNVIYLLNGSHFVNPPLPFWAWVYICMLPYASIKDKWDKTEAITTCKRKLKINWHWICLKSKLDETKYKFHPHFR